MRSVLVCLIRALILSLLVTGCDGSPSQPTFQSVKPSENSMIKIETNFGDIVLQLDAEKAPVTVQNFLDYLRAGFYDETIFHRVIPGFMIQGGGLTAGLVEKTTNEPIKNEASNGLGNKRGSIAMARTPNPHSATSQFFINTVDNEFLNFQDASGQGWGYAVFGAVVKGMDVVDKISQVETSSQHGHQDVPVNVVTIKKVSELTEAEVATEKTAESEA